jgi:MATE family multidrug resistance protein
MFFHDKLTWIFTSSEPVLEAVNKLSILLAFTVLLNSVQPVLSGLLASMHALITIFI